MSDERRSNEEIQPELKGETENSSLPEEADMRETLGKGAAARESLEYFRERILEYAKNEDLKLELQRKVEQLKEPSFGFDEGVCYLLCFEILCNFCGRTLKALKGEIPPTEECKNILIDTLKCIDKVLASSAENLRNREANCAVMSIPEGLMASLTLSQEHPARMWRQSLPETVRETLETWLDECESLIEISQQKETGQRLEFGQTDYWFFENNGLRCSRIVNEWLDRFTCSVAFGSQYAKFDELERFFENESTAQESARELLKFLENPPSSAFGGRDLLFDRNREWALARLYDSLDRYSVFDKLKKFPEVIALDRRDLRKRRDKHICNALRLVATELLEEVGRIVKFVDREFQGQKKIAEEFMEGFRRGENRRRKRSFFFNGVIEGWPDPSMDRSLDTLRNSALLYCYLALADVDEKPFEKITATVGTTCLNSTEFEKSLAGKISFKETLVKAQERGKMLDCARAVAFLASRSHKVRYFVEKLLSETEWGSVSGGVKTEFYDCLNKLAGGEGIPHTQSLAAAASRFGEFANNFTHLLGAVHGLGEETVSLVAEKSIDLFEKFALSPWYDGVIISLDELKERLFPLKDYDAIKRFETKSSIFEDILGYLDKPLNKFKDPQRGSIVSELCYYKFLQQLGGYIIAIYWNLFLTTRPHLILGDAKSVEVRRKNDSELIVGVPVSNVNDKYAQNALNVRLIIEDSTNVENSEGKEDRNPPKFVVIKPPRVVEILPSGGRAEIMEFTLRLLEPCDVFPVRFRLEYDKFKGFEFLDKSELSMDSPIGTGWFNYDIVVPGGQAAKKKHALSFNRLNALGANGNVDFGVEGIEKLLNNRKTYVDNAINALTEDYLTDAGDVRRRLSSRGRWGVIFGERRVGKTVILSLIKRRLRDDFPDAVVIRTSLSCIGGDGDFESGLAFNVLFELYELCSLCDVEIAQLCRDTLKICHIDLFNGEEIRWTSFCRFLKLFISRLRNDTTHARSVVLLVDEFTDIYPKLLNGSLSVDFLRRWAQMIDDTNLLCVIVGGEHTWDMIKTYGTNAARSATPIYVEYLNEENVRDFVHYVLYEAPEDNVSSEESYLSKESEGDVIERIWRLTRGQPFLLVKVCLWVVERLKTSETPMLTQSTVDDSLRYIVEEGTDATWLKMSLFGLLYDPFTEFDGKVEQGAVPRLEDDCVRDDNETILDAIVDLADSDTHRCEYGELMKRCCEKMNEETFKRRFRSLIFRKVIKDNVSIFVDLYYEIMTLVQRKRKNDL